MHATRSLSTAASRNILESRRRICDGVDITHKRLSRWWASTTGFTSVCLYPRAASSMPCGCEVVPDTIGSAEVNLVGRLPAESVMGHLGVVLVDVEIDQLPELPEAVERM